MKKVLGAVWEYFKRLDKTLLLLCLIISGFGIFLLYTLNLNDISSFVSSRQWKTQTVATVLGIVAALVLAALLVPGLDSLDMVAVRSRFADTCAASLYLLGQGR